MSKPRAIDSKEVKAVNTRKATWKERDFLRKFEDTLVEENENITAKEIMEARKIALLRFRDSQKANSNAASDLALALIAEEETEDEQEDSE